MTRDDVLEVLAVVALKWPHSNLGQPDEAVTGWMHELGEFDRVDVESSLDRLGDREWAPTAGIVAGRVRADLQGPAVPFDEVGTAMMRAQHWLPYDPEGHYSPADTARAVAVLADRGVHESVLRFVQERGLRAVVTMPWPDRHSLDPNQAADHRDAARHYRDVTVDGWRRDPRPGLALERACRSAGLEPAELLDIAATARRESLARADAASRLALPAPADERDEDDGETVPFEQALEHYRAERAAVEERRAAEAAEVERAAAADAVAYRAAEAELAAHTLSREGAR